MRTLTNDFVGDIAKGTWKRTGDSEAQSLTPTLVNEYLAGNLYVLVHTTFKPNGEVRGQIRPPIELQPLKQAQPGRCGPTSVGTSLAWFAETDPANFGTLIPHSGTTITTADKFNAINAIAAEMNTTGDGTTDSHFVGGIKKYVESVGHTGDFVIKVYDTPSFREYKHELRAGEDVLVGISRGSNSHWLVGRSFSDVLLDNTTPANTADDYYTVSFVDTGTGSVYHSRIRRSASGPVPWEIEYNELWWAFDLMVSVSPTQARPNATTAQYFIGQNKGGDFTFTLLGDPNIQTPRTLQLAPNAQGDIVLARILLRAVTTGEDTFSFVNPSGTGDTIKLVYIDLSGNVQTWSPVGFKIPAAKIIVGGEAVSDLEAVTDLIQVIDPTTKVASVQLRLDKIVNKSTTTDVTAQTPLVAYKASLAFDSTCMSIVDAEGPTGFTFNLIAAGQVDVQAPLTGTGPQPLAHLMVRISGDRTVVCNMNLTSAEIDQGGGAAKILPTTPLSTIALQRGNADASPDSTPSNTSVNIGDALSIVLFTVNVPSNVRKYACNDPNKPASEKCLLGANAASVRHDGTAGDKVTIADALLVVQCTVFKKNALCP